MTKRLYENTWVTFAVAPSPTPPLNDTDGAFETLEDVHELLAFVVSDFEAGALDGEDAAVGVSLFDSIEKLAAAGKALCAARVADTRHWRRAGDRTPAHWLARTTGCSMGEALSATQVPERLRHLPETDSQFRAGGLTLAQTRHITEAAIADPSAEADLLELAHREPLTVLRQECQRVMAAACEDDEARYRKVHSNRYLRHWTDGTGAFRLDASLTPDVGAEVLAALSPVAKRLAREARRGGCKVRKDALLADALAQVCRGTDESGNANRSRVAINIRVDQSAWLRGRTAPGENCEVDGAGPIPVSVAQALVEDGLVNVVGTEGDDVVSLVSHSRYIPARVRRALIARDPVCVVPGCYQRESLEFHHWREDFAKSGRTSLDDLARTCGFHHQLLTQGVFVLRGGPGRWEFVPKMALERQAERDRSSGIDPPTLVFA